MIGYIKDGVYHKEATDPSRFVTDSTITHKGADHDNQRRDHRHDLIQPYDRDGKPNADFVTYYPDEAKDYGFIPNKENQ